MQQLRYSGPSSPRMANNCRCNINQNIGHVYDVFVAGARPALDQGAFGGQPLLLLSSFNPTSKPFIHYTFDFVVIQGPYNVVSYPKHDFRMSSL